MARKKKTIETDIIAIIDMSGSMNLLIDSTISGFNEFLQEQQSIEGEARLTLVLFSGHGMHGARKVYDKQDIRFVVPLSRETYRPIGNTPLYDAIGISLASAFTAFPDRKTVVFVITDGMENSSTVYDRQSVKQLISQRKEAGWEFIFIGANLDREYAWDLGFDRNSTYFYNANPHSTQAVYTNVTRGLSNSRLGVTHTVSENISQEDLSVS